MPNGFHGPKEEWEKMTEPLCEMDATFTAFTKAHRLTITKGLRITTIGRLAS